MHYWILKFEAAVAIPVSHIETAMMRACPGKLTRAADPWQGNPRDYYSRLHHLAVGEQLSTSLVQHGMIPHDEPLTVASVTFLLSVAPAFADNTRVRMTLVEALAPDGFVDTTDAYSPAQIVDDALAAGEHSLAAQMRSNITRVLVARAPQYRHVSLVRTRPDDFDAVLRAYERPHEIVSASFTGCDLTALPQQLTRFENLKMLSLEEPKLTPQALHGFHFHKLEQLGLSHSGAQRIDAKDLAGVPALRSLFLAETPLAHLDPELVRVCPHLVHISITRTPLAKRVSELGDHFAGVRIDADG